MTPGYYERITDYLASGGFVMFPLIILAMILWFCIGFRIYTLRRGSLINLRIAVSKAVSGELPKGSGIIVKAVYAAAGEIKPGVGDIKNRIDAVFGSFNVEMDKYSILTRAIVAVAPLLGLLGTVSGMIETFDSLGDMTLFSQSGGIAGGISLALFTTQMGLVVAIPGLLIGKIMDQKKRALEIDMQKIKEIVVSIDAEQNSALKIIELNGGVL
jgi:biopolymer transport protein ExbB